MQSTLRRVETSIPDYVSTFLIQSVSDIDKAIQMLGDGDRELTSHVLQISSNTFYYSEYYLDRLDIFEWDHHMLPASEQVGPYAAELAMEKLAPAIAKAKFRGTLSLPCANLHDEEVAKLAAAVEANTSLTGIVCFGNPGCLYIEKCEALRTAIIKTKAPIEYVDHGLITTVWTKLAAERARYIATKSRGGGIISTMRNKVVQIIKPAGAESKHPAPSEPQIAVIPDSSHPQADKRLAYRLPIAPDSPASALDRSRLRHVDTESSGDEKGEAQPQSGPEVSRLGRPNLRHVDTTTSGEEDSDADHSPIAPLDRSRLRHVETRPFGEKKVETRGPSGPRYGVEGPILRHVDTTSGEEDGGGSDFDNVALSRAMIPPHRRRGPSVDRVGAIAQADEQLHTMITLAGASNPEIEGHSTTTKPQRTSVGTAATAGIRRDPPAIAKPQRTSVGTVATAGIRRAPPATTEPHHNSPSSTETADLGRKLLIHAQDGGNIDSLQLRAPNETPASVPTVMEHMVNLPLSAETGKDLFLYATSNDYVSGVTQPLDAVVKNSGTELRIAICKKWENKASFKAHTSVIRFVVFAGPSQLVTCSVDGEIKVWKVPSGEQIAKLHISGSQVSAMALSSHSLAVGTNEGTIYLFDSKTWSSSCQATWAASQGASAVGSLAWLGASPMLISGLFSGKIKIWDTAEKKFDVPWWGQREPGSGIICVASSPNGKYMCSLCEKPGEDGANGETRCIVYSFDGGVRKEDRGPSRFNRLSGYSGMLFVARFSPDSRLLATGGSNGELLLFDVSTLNPLRRLFKHKGRVEHLAFCDSLLVSGGTDRKVCVWNEEGEMIKSLGVSEGVCSDYLHCLDVTQDARLLAMAGSEQLTSKRDLDENLNDCYYVKLWGPI